MLTKPFMCHLEGMLADATGEKVSINMVEPLSGGSINRALKLQTSNMSYFLKFNSADQFPGMFESEKRGLKVLRETGTVTIPEVICSGEFESKAYLVLEMITPGGNNKMFQEKLGRNLATLHTKQASMFGLDHDNYIGSLPQSNTQQLSGIDFMIQERFQPLVHQAATKNLLPANVAKRFETLYKTLPSLLPDEKPVLLHGDLWNGNVLSGLDGNAWLIDPAIYFGFRETDIAMTYLFGGFDTAFYDSYNAEQPLLPDWKERTKLFQLYPLLVHLNLFGTGYLGGVKTTLEKYT